MEKSNGAYTEMMDVVGLIRERLSTSEDDRWDEVAEELADMAEELAGSVEKLDSLLKSDSQLPDAWA